MQTKRNEATKARSSARRTCWCFASACRHRASGGAHPRGRGRGATASTRIPRSTHTPAAVPGEVKHLERPVLLERRRERPGPRRPDSLVPRQEKPPDARRRPGHAQDNPFPIPVTSGLVDGGARRRGLNAVTVFSSFFFSSSSSSSSSSFGGGRALEECRGDVPGRTEEGGGSDTVIKIVQQRSGVCFSWCV